jgi:hypothetical protein
LPKHEALATAYQIVEVLGLQNAVDSGQCWIAAGYLIYGIKDDNATCHTRDVIADIRSELV